MNKWEVDEHEQWSEKVRSHCFCPQKCSTKTETIKGSNKRESFVESMGMNVTNLKNETLFLSFTAIITIRNG